MTAEQAFCRDLNFYLNRLDKSIRGGRFNRLITTTTDVITAQSRTLNRELNSAKETNLRYKRKNRCYE